MAPLPLRIPIIGIGCCCARVINGETATVPLRATIKSRRLMPLPQPEGYHIIARIVGFCITTIAKKVDQKFLSYSSGALTRSS